MELILKGVTKKYGQSTVVNQLDFSFGAGIYGLLGANGAGKTTLMRMICGVLKTSAGEILLNGESIYSLGERYRDILGYLPQNFDYYQDFTATEFMHYMAALKGLRPGEAKKRTDRLLGELNLYKVKRKKIRTYSGGMKRRLGIAQALLNDPKILILDEPTAGLDPKERVHFKKLLSEYAKQKIIFLSTHIVSDVEDIANVILIMKDGQFVMTGSPETIISGLKGQIWEFTIREEELKSIENKYDIMNIYHNNQSLQVKVISTTQPDVNAKQVEPRLEDLYMQCFGFCNADKGDE